MDFEKVAIGFALMFFMFLVMGWGVPTEFMNAATGFFKTTNDAFYAAYRRTLRFRLIFAVFCAAILALGFADESWFTGWIVVVPIAGYIGVIMYCTWWAEMRAREAEKLNAPSAG